MKRLDCFIVPFWMDTALAVALLMVNLRALDLHATPTQLGLIGFAWGLPYAFLCPMLGRAADRYDRRMMLLGGGLIYGCSLVLSGLATAPHDLMITASLGALGCALFWPTVESLLHAPEPVETRRRTGLFNVGWTTGMIVGTAAGGFVYHHIGPRPGFTAMGLLSAIASLYLAVRLQNESAVPAVELVRDQHTSGVPAKRRQTFLWIAWIGNLSLLITAGGVGTIFPIFGRSIRIDDGPIGVLLAVQAIGLALSFAALARTDRWHYRGSLMVWAQVLAAFTFVVLAIAHEWVVIAPAMLLLGFARGATYSASLYYGLDQLEAQGANSGIHEAVVGSGFMLGPLVAGLAADHLSVRSAFAVMVVVILVGLAAQQRLWSYRNAGPAASSR